MNNLIFRATDFVGTLNPTGQYVTNGDGAIAGLMGAALALIVILGVGIIIYAGFKYIMARGDPREAQAAQSIITNTVIGLIISFLAYLIVRVVLGALGIGGALPGSLPT